jgi:hypothetical protein
LFNALVEDLQHAMDKNHIAFCAQNKLLEQLAPTHRKIINKPRGFSYLTHLLRRHARACRIAAMVAERDGSQRVPSVTTGTRDG